MNENSTLHALIIAKALHRENKTKEAICELDRALLKDANPELYYERGFYNETIGLLEEAERDYSEAIALSPTVKYLTARGRFLADTMQDPESGLADFLMAERLCPSETTVQDHLSLCYLQLGDFDKATLHANAFVSREPKNADAHLRLGQCLLFQKKWSDAVTALRTATLLDPTSSQALSLLATSLRNTNDLQGAKAALLASLDIESSVDTLIALGSLLIDLNEPKNALGVLRAINVSALSECQSLLMNGYTIIAKDRLAE